MRESWKPIVGYEGLYEISDHGRVRSLKRVVRLNEFTNRHQEDIIMKAVLSGPQRQYLKVSLANNGVKKIFAVHRLVALHFIAPVEGKNFVLHNDDDPLNNHVSNLRWGTQSENMRDITRLNGWKNRRSKLTQSERMEILGSTDSLKELSARYGIHQTYASKLRNGYKEKPRS